MPRYKPPSAAPNGSSTTPAGAVWYGARRVFAYAQHTPVDQRTLNIPSPKGWT
jgi:hypothetical protein